MIENEEAGPEKREGVDGVSDAIPSSQAENAPANGSHRKDGTNGAKGSHEDHKSEPHRLLSRLTVNEWLTFFIGVGSLVVSYLTYKNATDTSDLKNAVSNLTTLAGEARRQADAMGDQAKAMQGQLNQMTVNQRAWLSVGKFSINDIQIFPVGAGILADTNYEITNLGHSPAIAVFIKTGLVFVGAEKFDIDVARRICKPQPTGEERLMNNYSDTILPGQTLTINGFPSDAGSFSHSISALQEAGRYIVDGDFILAGCISYRDLGSNIRHDTGFAFRAQAFQLQKADYTVKPLPIDIGQKGEVKTGPLIVTPYAYGNFAD